MRELSMAASCTPPTGDHARNQGMCPDQESNCDLPGHRRTLNQ